MSRPKLVGESAHDARLVTSNAAYMLVLQLTNYLFPLLLVPYLTRKLGLELFAVIAFGTSAAQLAGVGTDFGFNLSATARIARARGAHKPVHEEYSAVLLAKLPLSLLALVALACIPLVVGRFSAHVWYFVWMGVGAACQSYQSFWFFQGIERLRLIAAYTVVARLGYFAATILLTSLEIRVVYVGLAFAVAQVLGCLVSFRLATRHGGVITRVPWSAGRLALVESAPFFWSRAAVALYSIGGVLFLGFAGRPRDVALYSVADQVFRAGLSAFNPLVQALYPTMMRSLNLALFQRMLAAALLAAAVTCAGGWIFGSQAIAFLLGEHSQPAVTANRVLFVALLFAVPSMLIGYPLLGALDRVDRANASVIVGAMIHAVLLTGLLVSSRVSIVAVAASVLIVEAAVLSLRVGWAFDSLRDRVQLQVDR